MTQILRLFLCLDLQGASSRFRAMDKNGLKHSRGGKLRVPEMVSLGPLRRGASIRRRLNTRFMATGSAFLVAGIFLLVALAQLLSLDGIEARLGPSVALAETAKTEVLIPAGVVEEDVAEAAGAEAVAPAERELEVAALGDAAQTGPVRQSVTVKKGGTLMRTLIDAGADRRQAHQAIAALEKVFDPRRLQVGQEILITSEPMESGADRLLSVALPLTAEREIAAVRSDDGSFIPDEINKPLHRELMRAEGEISDTLFLATGRAGVPPQIVMDAIRIFSWEIDFQRDIQKGDRFHLLFERFFSESGEVVRDGRVVFASLVLSGRELSLYRHKLEDGSTGYFDKSGQSARRALLRTPVDGARLSSGFGRRKHPILGYTRIHRGIDFAAPRGTPIVAAGDGVIEYAGRNGAYGRYVRIRHNGSYKTAYGHMHRIAKGLRSGVRVRQGQVIGQVGSTGRSTGPHLHYEVINKGKQISPMRLRLPTGEALSGAALDRFAERRIKIDAQLAGTPTLLDRRKLTAPPCWGWFARLGVAKAISP